MSYTLQRSGVNASIRRSGDVFKFEVEIDGAIPLRGECALPATAREEICQHARSVAANSRATDDRRGERLAAEVFAWAREVRV